MIGDALISPFLVILVAGAGIGCALGIVSYFLGLLFGTFRDIVHIFTRR